MAFELAATREPDGSEGVEQRSDAVAALGGAAAIKGGGEGFWRDWRGGAAEQVDQDVDLLGIADRPFRLVDDRDDGEVGFLLDAVGASNLVAALGDLIVGAQLAQEAARFFGDAGLVDGDKAGEQVFLGLELGIGLIGAGRGSAGAADAQGPRNNISPSVSSTGRARSCFYCPGNCAIGLPLFTRSTHTPADPDGLRIGMAKTAPRSTPASEMADDTPMNRSLYVAKTAKQDEFYTQYVDIQKEVEAYLEFDKDTFRGKVIYCNCDDPFESNFFKYFATNFNRLGLKKLVSTSYDGSPIAGAQLTFGEYVESSGKGQEPQAIAVELEEVTDLNGDGATGIDDVELFLKRNPHTRTRLVGGGDFRSAECIALLKQADIVVTNPPFSLFREYVAQLVEHGKKFLVIGNMQATTYKEVFPLIKTDRLWMGATIHSGDREFRVPDHYPLDAAGWRIDENGVKYIRVKGVRWWTNLDHGRRHEELSLMTMADNLKFSKHKEIKGRTAYDQYDNFDAIEVPFTDAIPSDYDGVMGVPISFLDKYNPDQFEILGNDDLDYPATRTYGSKKKIIDGKASRSNTGALRCVLRSDTFGPGTYFDVGYPVRGVYRRIFIRNRHATGTKK